MKIVEEPNEIYDIEVINVISAQYIDNYSIKIQFDNKFEQTVDFTSFLNNSHHPTIKKYRDKNLFQEFKIVNGNLNWNDYDMIFPIHELYSGKI